LGGMVKKYKTIYNKRGINGYRGNIEMNIITCAVYIVILLSLYYFVFWEAINDMPWAIWFKKLSRFVINVDSMIIEEVLR